MEGKRKTMRLREWIITQIESGRYSGLCWENSEKSMFRIPWKHAAKQDYKENEDAALFKAWAMHKGKYCEGTDQADPSVWKTRVRCALNKSSDFEEVPERSQLDISQPYKVYRIQPVRGMDAGAEEGQHRGCEADGGCKQKVDPVCLHQRPASVNICTALLPALDDVGMDPSGVFCSWALSGMLASSSAGAFAPVNDHEEIHITDFRLRVRLFYQGQLVQDITSCTTGGCWILHGAVSAEDERLYGPRAAEPVHFPLPEVIQAAAAVSDVMARLLPHLQRGVLVWVAPEGVFIKRFCQSRVYWSGPLAQHKDRPNKIEREKTCKLLDVYVFLQELKFFLQGAGPKPKFEIDLCFGEEYPQPNHCKAKKLITAHIEPLFAKNLMRSARRPLGDSVLQVRDSNEDRQQSGKHPRLDLPETFGREQPVASYE